MKRWTLRILLCLILLAGGAVTTVAVAWGLACWQRYDRTAPMASQEEPDHIVWTLSAYRAPGSVLIGSLRAIDPVVPVRNYGVDQLVPRWTGLHTPLEETSLRDEYRSVEGHGWPSYALFVEWRRDSMNVRASWEVLGGIPVPVEREYRHLSTPVALPLCPIWPGFLIDTLFYAAIWFGVFFGFASAKRFIRSKRGRCLRCGYDLRGQVMSDQRLAISGETAGKTAGCPECGWNREQSAA